MEQDLERMGELGGRFKWKSQEEELKRSKIKKRSEEIEPKEVDLEPFDQTWNARNKSLRIDPRRDPRRVDRALPTSPIRITCASFQICILGRCFVCVS